MDNIQQFWLVWQPNHGPPSIRHRDFETAVGEAKRLAGENPGHSFFVLEATAKAHFEPGVTVQFARRVDPEIPF